MKIRLYFLMMLFCAVGQESKGMGVDHEITITDAEGSRHTISQQAALYAPEIKNIFESDNNYYEPVPLLNIKHLAMLRLLNRLELCAQQSGTEGEYNVPLCVEKSLYALPLSALIEDAQAADYVGACALLNVVAWAIMFKMVEATQRIRISPLKRIIYKMFTGDLFMREMANRKKEMIRQIGALNNPNIRQLVSDFFLQYVKDTSPWKTQVILEGHTDAITAVACSPQQTKIATVSHDYTFRSWDMETFRQIMALSHRQAIPYRHHRHSMYSLAFSPDGKKIALGSFDGRIIIVDADTYRPLSEWRGHGNVVSSIAFSRDGTRFVTGSWDYTARLWDARTYRPIGDPLPKHGSFITAVIFSPDNKTVVTSSRDRTICMWDSGTHELKGTLRGHTAEVRSIDISADGTTIVSGSDDKTVRLWDVCTGLQMGEFTLSDMITAVAFSPNDKYIIAGAVNGIAYIWDRKTGKKMNELRGHSRRITAITYSPDGTKIITASADKTVRVWYQPLV